ncbi:MAG TPA: YicC/YloC family endoribonuclease, partial [Acidobacteriota bacterium]|nr:YicC/YloC family endoribonuclease [Acidobacteriota bacterium]
MIRSMTAFAKSSYEGKEFTLDVFVRSYNHRFLDINLKLPIELLHIEGEIRSFISRYLSRGRIEMTLKTTFLKEGIYQVYINRALVARLISEVQVLKEQFGLAEEVDLASLLRIPGLIEVQTDVQRISREILDEIKEIIDTSLQSLLQMRIQEGQILAKDIGERLDSLLHMVDTIETMAKNYPREVRTKLEKNLLELLNGQSVDPSRLLQEVA